MPVHWRQSDSRLPPTCAEESSDPITKLLISSERLRLSIAFAPFDRYARSLRAKREIDAREVEAV
jgi:hypothetical protein